MKTFKQRAKFGNGFGDTKGVLNTAQRRAAELRLNEERLERLSRQLEHGERVTRRVWVLPHSTW